MIQYSTQCNSHSSELLGDRINTATHDRRTLQHQVKITGTSISQFSITGERDYFTVFLTDEDGDEILYLGKIPGNDCDSSAELEQTRVITYDTDRFISFKFSRDVLQTMEASFRGPVIPDHAQRNTNDSF